MKNKKKKIIVSVSLLILFLLLLIMQRNVNKLSQIVQQTSKATVYTKIGNQDFDITSLIEQNLVPTISAGMIPVKQDGEYWKIVDKEDNTWFNYSNGIPAFMMLNDGKYQSEEYYQMPATQEIAKAGTQINKSSTDLGSIYMWVPRYAYNEDGEIIYIRQTASVVGTYTMPNIFSYNTDKEDYALAGIWVECNVTTELTNKIEEMNTQDSKYGFIANTKTNAMTEDEQVAIQRIVENLANSVGRHPRRPTYR